MGWGPEVRGILSAISPRAARNQCVPRCGGWPIRRGSGPRYSDIDMLVFLSVSADNRVHALPNCLAHTTQWHAVLKDKLLLHATMTGKTNE